MFVSTLHKQTAQTQVQGKLRAVWYADPVWRQGTWVYDLTKLCKGDLLLVFHARNSYEHLHLHGFICDEDSQGHVMIASDPSKTYGRYGNLGEPGSFSLTWRQVYELCCLEELPRCARKGCRCTMILQGKTVTEWRRVRRHEVRAAQKYIVFWRKKEI